MGRFVEEADRGQWTLLPECLDDFIDESNPVRVIDVFVAALDLAEMSFEGVEPAATGRPSYHPSVLLKLYIYGYLNRVQSSRRLEREAGRNVEVMWLLGRLAPDHKTVADSAKTMAWRCVGYVRASSNSAARWASSRRRALPSRQQVQGREQSGQELHAGEGGTAACPAGGERRALSEPT